jgi:regulator of replication initiation timing
VPLEAFVALPSGKRNKSLGETRCRVAGCQRPTSGSAGLCAAHARQRRDLGVTVEAFLARDDLVGKPSFGDCVVPACIRRAAGKRAQILQRAAQAPPDASLPRTSQVSRQSLLADLANLRAHNERLRRQNAKLTKRLSDALGEEVFRASGLGGPDQTEALRRRVGELEQTTADLRQQLQERTEELGVARATNRDLMAEVNRLPGRWPTADTTRKRTPRR